METSNHLFAAGYIDPQESYDSPYFTPAEVDEKETDISIEKLVRYYKSGFLTPQDFERVLKSFIDRKDNLLHECKNQLEYLNEKFGETGTTNQLLGKLKRFTDGK